MRNENEASNEHTLSSPTSVPSAPSVGTGDPNPKGFLARPSDENAISSVSVPLKSGHLTFTAVECFDPTAKRRLRGLVFSLTCDPPELASIMIPDDGRTWLGPDNKPLTPGKTAPIIQLQDPKQQRLDEEIDRVSLDVDLKLHQVGTVKVLFNMDVTDTPGTIHAQEPTALTVKIL